MSTLGDWIDAVCTELGIDRAEVREGTILHLARDVSHQVDRPAAPVTAFLLGYAVGGGRPLAATAERLTELAADWASGQPQPADPA
ncbi:MAG TPA: DUF6457 domain-containing protein [Streptosporangiaceae bacterium]|nr:DUF6457 domain-containing protein [Streptosporangiaceae bacterium]